MNPIFWFPSGPGLLMCNIYFSDKATSIPSPWTRGREDSGFRAPLRGRWPFLARGQILVWHGCPLIFKRISASTETGKLLQGMTGYSSLLR